MRVSVSLAEEGDLRRVSRDDAAAVVEAVTAWQPHFRSVRGEAFVHAADAFHLLGGELPPASGAPEQYENGIGMSAVLLDEAAEIGEARRTEESVRILTGTLADPVIADAAELLGARVRPFVVTNRLFGPHVTVTGLLGGAEVIDALRDDPLAPGELLVAPRTFLPASLGRCLDDVGEEELAAACGAGTLVPAHSLGEAFGTLSR